MWLVTTDGFYSVVKYDPKKGKTLKNPYRLAEVPVEDWLVVRARVRRDLERLGIHDLVVEKTMIGDYAYRAIVSRQEWADYLLTATYDIDYDSHFKEEASRNRPGRHSVYMDVWSALNRLETGGKSWYGYRQYKGGVTPKPSPEPARNDRTSILHQEDEEQLSGIECWACGFAPLSDDKLDDDGLCKFCRGAMAKRTFD